MNPAAYRHLIDCVVGIVFIATPHKGAGIQSSAEIVASVAEKAGIGTKTHLLQILQPESVALDKIVSDFALMANERGIRLCCFYEQQDSDLAAIARGFGISFLPAVKVRKFFQRLSSTKFINIA